MWLTEGKWNEKYEKLLSNYLGVDYISTCNSGSSANLIALSALTSRRLGDRQLVKGDEVITTALCFPTTVFPIIQLGLIPVFCDVDSTLNINIGQIEECITPRTKAIMIANTLGNPNDWETIMEIALRRRLWVIQDNCDSLATTYHGGHIQGDIATYSFFPAHEITTGEGGAVATNSELLHLIIRSMKNWGRSCYCKPGEDNKCGQRFKKFSGKLPYGFDHKYTFTELGYNLKMTEWSAAIGCSQLERLEEFTKARRYNHAILTGLLLEFNDYLEVPVSVDDSFPVWFGFPIILKANSSRFNKHDLINHLNRNGIMTREIFAGNILRQPLFTDNEIKIRIRYSATYLDSSRLVENDFKEFLPETDRVMRHGFWIGCHPGIDYSSRFKIYNAFKEYFS